LSIYPVYASINIGKLFDFYLIINFISIISIFLSGLNIINFADLIFSLQIISLHTGQNYLLIDFSACYKKHIQQKIWPHSVIYGATNIS